MRHDYNFMQHDYTAKQHDYNDKWNEYNVIAPRRLFFAAQQRIAITLSPNYYQKMRCFTTRKNQEEHGPDVM